jgi:hypothetical protein
MISVPMMLLSIVNLGIFLQGNSLSSRLSAIATLLVAYAAFIPTIRARVPTTPDVTISDIMLYTLMLLSLLCFLRSYIDWMYLPTELAHYDCFDDAPCHTPGGEMGFSLFRSVLWLLGQ